MTPESLKSFHNHKETTDPAQTEMNFETEVREKLKDKHGRTMEEIISLYKVGPGKIKEMILKDGEWYVGSQTAEDWNKAWGEIEEAEKHDRYH